jgi:hypothetical protein
LQRATDLSTTPDAAGLFARLSYIDMIGRVKELAAVQAPHRLPRGHGEALAGIQTPHNPTQLATARRP